MDCAKQGGLKDTTLTNILELYPCEDMGSNMLPL